MPKLEFFTSQTITVVLKELNDQTCAPTNCEELSYLSSFAVVLKFHFRMEFAAEN
jgi:hypothetical protein